MIAGGGIAGAVQAATTGARGASSLTTGGFANPLLSTAEAGGSLLLSLLALALPVLAAAAAVILVWVAWSRLLRRRRAVA